MYLRYESNLQCVLNSICAHVFALTEVDTMDCGIEMTKIKLVNLA